MTVLTVAVALISALVILVQWAIGRIREDRIAEGEQLLNLLRVQLRIYASNHRAKNTPEADIKAATNEHWVGRITEYLGDDQ